MATRRKPRMKGATRGTRMMTRAEFREHVNNYLVPNALGRDMERLFEHDTLVSMLKVSARTTNCLRAARIRSVAQLATKTPKELLGIRFFGEKCLREVQNVLRNYHRKLGREAKTKRKG